MVNKCILLVSFIFLSSFAIADEQLERMESISEEMTTLMFNAMVDSAKSEGADTSVLETLIPDASWDEPMRDAGKCMLEKYKQKIDADGVDKMLDELEAIIPTLRTGGMEAMEKMANIQPSGISDEESMAINQECGMIELQQEKMMANEFVNELMRLSMGN